ncbi:MAG: alpha/beta hydrolase [Rikenellaceae bacterium]
MVKKALALLILFNTTATASYRPDRLLGDQFEQLQLNMSDDYSGRVVATLVRPTSQPVSERAILYIHGFNDYFFQRELAEQFTSHGYRFYALDLRKYGRSILPENNIFELRDITEYDEEIDRAIEIITSEGGGDITIMGHSTGGLVATLYAHHHRDRVDRVILNSPFFDMNNTPFLDNVLIPIVAAYAKIAPCTKIPMGSSTAYAESLLKEHQGEWSFDTSLKFSPSPPMESSWLRAIYLAHREVQSIRDLDIPILLLYSDKSVHDDEWSEEFQYADSVLDVEDIKHYGSQLGSQVTSAQIVGAMHDIILSAPEIRANAYNVIFDWLD